MATEEDDKDKGGGEGDGGEPKPEGTEPSSACSKCGSANETNAKFCDQCGGSMAAPRADEDEEEEAPDSDPAPAPGKPSAPPPAKPPPPKASSLAGLAGLHEGASVPAIISALLPKTTLSDFAIKLTGTRSEREAIGALKTMASEAARAVTLDASLRSSEAKRDWRDRMDLLGKLATVKSPGEIYVYDVNETTGKKTKRPKPLYANCDLEELRGEVTAALKAGPSARRTPFEPDAAKAASSGAANSIEAAKKHPAVLAAAARPGAQSLETLAAAFVASFPQGASK